MKSEHKTYFKVRDYECDAQGIVNNATYMNYLEHARHEFLLNKQINFAKLIKQGINLVVVKAQLNYKNPLKSCDKFFVNTKIKSISKLKFMLQQNLYCEDKLMLNATITATAIDKNNKPFMLDEIKQYLKND